jgi:hypothetical protein
MKTSFKTTLSIALLLLCTSLSNAQVSSATSDEDSLFKQHELRLNALYLLIGAIEVNYEYLLNENSGVGLSGLYTYDDGLWEYKYNVTGFYRHYFGKKYAGGFYGEAFLSYNGIEDYYYYNYGGSWSWDEKTSHNLGAGFAFGTKLVSKENFLLDIGAGLSRNFISSGYDDWLVPRFNISFGYRF